jgi:predicted Zn-ribbon and HTH transcriptional regulator
MVHFFALVLISLSQFCTIISSEITSIQELDSPSINQLIEQNDESILRIENDRVFLDAERIHPTQQGLVLETSKQYYLIHQLHSSEQGCYLLQSKTNNVIYPRIVCKNCNQVFFPSIYNKGKCPICKQQN